MASLNKINLAKCTEIVGTNVPIYTLGKPYVRTTEDEQYDRAERKWKDEVNQQACLTFLRSNPSGRINFN